MEHEQEQDHSQGREQAQEQEYARGRDEYKPWRKMKRKSVDPDF